MSKAHVHAAAGTPHVHAALIKAWADGAEIECLYANGKWLACTPIWTTHTTYRVKPEVVSSMTVSEAHRVYSMAWDVASVGGDPSAFATAAKAVADEAVRRYVKETANK